MYLIDDLTKFYPLENNLQLLQENLPSQNFINVHNRIGRSWGCPALPTYLNREIINTIKGGSCIYMHADQDSYAYNSKYSLRNIKSKEGIVAQP